MRQLSCVLVLSVVAVLLCAVADVQSTKTDKQKPKRGRGRCQDRTTTTISANDLEEHGYTVHCNVGVITDLEVVGHHGECQGLTPQLFIQRNSCYWKRNCTLSYDTEATNFMLKLFHGDPSECVTKQPQRFSVSYNCTNVRQRSAAFVYDVMGAKDTTTKVKAGIVRSHEGNPWHYKPLDTGAAATKLTLQRPKGDKKKFRHFVYTIRSLNLAPDDALKVTWTNNRKKAVTRKFTSNDTVTLADDVKTSTHVITAPADVTFSVDASEYSDGRDGFVICFRWMRWKKRHRQSGYSACHKLIVHKKCGRRARRPQNPK